MAVVGLGTIGCNDISPGTVGCNDVELDPTAYEREGHDSPGAAMPFCTVVETLTVLDCRALGICTVILLSLLAVISCQLQLVVAMRVSPSSPMARHDRPSIALAGNQYALAAALASTGTSSHGR